MGLAMVAAVRGYKTIFVMPDKMSRGEDPPPCAPSAARSWSARPTSSRRPAQLLQRRRRLAHETPNAIYANQYHNQSNPIAHYHSTGPEIWEQTGGEVDVLVVSRWAPAAPSAAPAST
jgi:cystathionine beta-synthase